MTNRLLKWFGFSIGLTLLPVILSVIMRGIINAPIQLSSYTNEILFMSVTLSATSIGEIVTLIEKDVRGPHITFLLIMLIFISLICISVYEIVNMGAIMTISINYSLTSALTIVGGLTSLVIGVMCQIFLSKVDG